MSDVGDLDTKGVRGREQIWREGRDAGGRRKRGGGTIQEAVGQRTDAAKGVDCEGQEEDVVREEVLRDTRGRGRDTSTVDAIGTTKLVQFSKALITTYLKCTYLGACARMCCACTT